MTDRDVCSSVVINDKVSKVLGLIPQRDIVRNVYQLIVYRTSVFYPLHLSSPSLIIPRMQRIYLLRIEGVYTSSVKKNQINLRCCCPYGFCKIYGQQEAR